MLAWIGLIYVVLCIVGVHVATSYLCTVSASRKIRLQDIGFAVLCIFANIPMFVFLFFADSTKKKFEHRTQAKQAESQESAVRIIRTYIPFFKLDKTTVGELLDSGNPHAYLVALFLINKQSKGYGTVVKEKYCEKVIAYILTISPADLVIARVELKEKGISS